MQKWEEAIKAYQTLYVLNPQDEEALFNLGILGLQVQKIPQALESFQKLIKINPQSEKGHFFLAKISLEMKQYDRAKTVFPGNDQDQP